MAALTDHVAGQIVTFCWFPGPKILCLLKSYNKAVSTGHVSGKNCISLLIADVTYCWFFGPINHMTSLDYIKWLLWSNTWLDKFVSVCWSLTFPKKSIPYHFCFDRAHDWKKLYWSGCIMALLAVHMAKEYINSQITIKYIDWPYWWTFWWWQIWSSLTFKQLAVLPRYHALLAL